jgi:quinohemoprotein ethanol dehydrogenase
VLAAYRARDGEPLWQFDAATGIMAPPVTYLVDGVQFVSVMAGWGGADGAANAQNRGSVKPGYGRILTFTIGGTAKLNAPAYGHRDAPTPAVTMTASPETLHEGKLLFNAACAQCHGQDAIAGPLPDLRYADRTVHAQFAAIVLEGTRASRGMPSFGALLGPEQVRAIQAYILSRAAEGAAAASK